MRVILVILGLVLGGGCAAAEATPSCEVNGLGDYEALCPSPRELVAVCGENARNELRDDGSGVLVGHCGYPLCDDDGNIACAGCPEGTAPHCIERARPAE